MQTLKQQKLWVEVKSSEACTLPRYETQGTVELTVNNTAIRLEIVDVDGVMTEQLLNSFVGKYVFTSDGSTSEVRLITSVDIEAGAPDTCFLIIDTPFETTNPGDFALNIVDPTDYEPVYGVFNSGSSTFTIDGVAYTNTKQFFTFENTSPKAPVVIYGDATYNISNSTSQQQS